MKQQLLITERPIGLHRAPPAKEPCTCGHSLVGIEARRTGEAGQWMRRCDWCCRATYYNTRPLKPRPVMHGQGPGRPRKEEIE